MSAAFLTYNWTDLALVAYLCVAVPAVQLRNSLRGRKSAPLGRAMRTVLMLGAPLVVLAADWRLAGRSAAALGLGVPIPLYGEIGLAVAAALIVGLFVTSLRSRPKADVRAQLEAAGLLLQTKAEFAGFMVLALVVGCGAEILFRGFLLWAFVPLAGVAGAVIIAALAYGIGHGFKDLRQAVGSIAAAFAFTIAYAFSHSLWWLMLIHIAAAVSGAVSGWRAGKITDG